MNLLFPLSGQESDEGLLYHSDNVVIGRLFKRIIELGIPVDALAPVAEWLSRIIDLEVSVFFEHVWQPMLERGVSADETMATAQTSLEVAYSLVSLLHLHLIYRLISSSDLPAQAISRILARSQQTGGDS